MTHPDCLKVSKWAAGIIIAGFVHAGALIWAARGVIASIEILKVQQDYVVERVGNVERDLREIKQNIGKDNGRIALHTHP